MGSAIDFVISKGLFKTRKGMSEKVNDVSKSTNAVSCHAQ